MEWQATPRTEVIGWDRLESTSVNILLMTKLLSLDPLSWGMDCLLTLWPLLIPCSLGNGCCTFGFLIFIIVERNFLYNSLYILTERSLKHLCSISAWVLVSFSLFLFHFLIVDSGPPGSGPLKDPNTHLFLKPSKTNHLSLLHFFFFGIILITAFCTVLWTSVHSSSGTLSK